jgi:hypothetical protein
VFLHSADTNLTFDQYAHSHTLQSCSFYSNLTINMHFYTHTTVSPNLCLERVRFTQISRSIRNFTHTLTVVPNLCLDAPVLSTAGDGSGDQVGAITHVVFVNHQSLYFFFLCALPCQVDAITHVAFVYQYCLALPEVQPRRSLLSIITCQLLLVLLSNIQSLTHSLFFRL